MPRRRNPELLILSNPEVIPGEGAARKAWEEFHLAPGENANAFRIPDVPGVPRTVMVLGAFEGLDVAEGRFDPPSQITIPARVKAGPWVVTDSGMRNLWVVARRKSDLSQFARQGNRFAASIYYYPPSNSGKYDRARGYKHEFGEGGKLARSRWPTVWPRILVVGSGRALRLVRPRRSGYTIQDRGIVG